MKKVISFVLVVCMLLTMITIPTFAATTLKLSTTELNIVKAYQKTIETSDAQYLNKYKYPGVTFKAADYGDGITAKILNPKYSKVYDSKAKMYKLCINGLTVVTDGQMLGITKTPSQLYIKTLKQKVYAYRELSDVKPEMLTINDLSESETLSLEEYLTSLYDADTANALMYPEDSQGAGTEEKPDTTIDKNDNTGIGSGSNPSSVSGAGTVNSPVEMNQKYTWSVTDKQYAYDLISGTFSLTVKNSKKVTADDIVKLGFKKPTDNDKVDYYLVNVLWEVKNAKLKKGEKGEGYGYLSGGWGLDVWGVKTADGDSYIGGCTDYGYDGSIGRAMNAVDKKITPGMNESCKAEGTLLLSVPKGKTSYMVIRNDSIEDYDSSFIYFKVK